MKKPVHVKSYKSALLVIDMLNDLELSVVFILRQATLKQKNITLDKKETNEEYL